MKRLLILITLSCLFIGISNAQNNKSKGTTTLFQFDWKEAKCWQITGTIRGLAKSSKGLKYVVERINLNTGKTAHDSSKFYKSCATEATLEVLYEDGTYKTYDLFKYAFADGTLKTVKISSTDTGRKIENIYNSTSEKIGD